MKGVKTMLQNNDIIEVENAQIRYPNFTGRPEKFSKEGGNRHFVLLVDEEMANELVDSGFTVKVREFEDGNKEFRVDVKLNYNSPFPPKVILITGKSKTVLTEETVGNLSMIDIDNIDLVLRVWDYAEKLGTKPGEPHMKFYVKAMYVTQSFDSFMSKYEFDEEEDGEVIPFN
jgi:hypothetical protein